MQESRTCLTKHNMRVDSKQFGKYMQYPNYGSKFDYSYFPYFSKNGTLQKVHLKILFSLKNLKESLKRGLKLPNLDVL